MSDSDTTFDDSNVEEDVKASEGWRNLRASHTKLAKELADARAALDKATTAQRTTTLTDLLKAKGISEKAAKYYPADADATAESVDKWLDEDGDLFAVAPAGSNGEQKTDTPGVADARKVAEAAATAPGIPPAGLDNVQKRLADLDPKSPDFMTEFTKIMVAATP